MATKVSDKDKSYDDVLIEPTDEELRNIFAASCVETLAQALGISTTEAYIRMENVQMMDNFIYPCYDTLHTESREHVTEDLLEYLHVWEKKKSQSTTAEQNK